MSALTLAKLSSSLMMDTGHGQRFNAGLNIKFDSKSQKVLGYTRKTDQGWEYSDKAIELIASYKVRRAAKDWADAAGRVPRGHQLARQQGQVQGSDGHCRLLPLARP